MRYLRLFGLLIILFIMSLAGVGQARGDEQSPNVSPTITWTRDTLDSTGDVGQFASLALDPSGLPHISYYNFNAYNLSHAYKTNNPINTPCLAAGWECETFPTNDHDGTHVVMDIRSNGNYGIFYFNLTQSALFFRGDQGDNLPYSNQTIDPYGQSAPNFQDFQYDRNDIPHGIYSSNKSIYYMSYVGSGGNCGLSAWQCDYAYSDPSISPLDGSLGLTYSGSPRIAVGIGSGLHYLSRVGSNGNCTSTWNCDKIENLPIFHVALSQPICQIICTTPVMIAYVEDVNGRLKLATSVESGGNCGFDDQAGKWQCDIIEKINGSFDSGISIFRYNGEPYIVYTDGDDRPNTTLKIAYPSPGGNCGPTLNGAGTWQCDTIDTGLRFVGNFPLYHDVGQYPSLAINSNGKFFVSYYDSDAGDLLYAEGQLENTPPPPTGTAKIYLPAVFR